jgi:hypothetical protein
MVKNIKKMILMVKQKLQFHEKSNTRGSKKITQRLWSRGSVIVFMKHHYWVDLRTLADEDTNM